MIRMKVISRIKTGTGREMGMGMEMMAKTGCGADAPVWLMSPNVCHKSINLQSGEGKCKARLTHLRLLLSFSDRPPLSEFTYWHSAKSQAGWQSLKFRHVGIYSNFDLCLPENIDSVHNSTEEYMEFTVIRECSLNKSFCGNIHFISNVSKEAVPEEEIWLNSWLKLNSEKPHSDSLLYNKNKNHIFNWYFI